MTTDFHIIHTSWQTHKTEIRLIRQRVFIDEQQVPKALEWEGHEDSYHYILALDHQKQAIGTGRIDARGHIGRMAVMKNWRNQGVGSAILKALIEFAQNRHDPSVVLNAQTTAIGFYEKQGFIICSDEFLDAGIPHRTMMRTLAGS
jgi:predicted GNAT family N-acyltransferase